MNTLLGAESKFGSHFCMDSIKFQPPETKLHFLDYWRVIRIRKAIIITVFLITAIIATAVTFILPESYASTTRIKVESDGLDISGMTTPAISSGGYDPFFIQTTFEIMQSQIVLSNVINKLNLNIEWGKKYFNGETLKSTETLEILKGRMSLAPVRNTKLIAITVYSDDRNEAATLANAIGEAYKDYRLQSRRQLTAKGLESMEEQFKNQEQQINAAQARVEQLRHDLGISGDFANASAPMPTLDYAELQALHGQQIQGERTYAELKVQLEKLHEMSPDKLRDVLPSLISDGSLGPLLDQFHEAQRKLSLMKVDYSPSNLNIIRVQTLIDTLDRQINDRVAGIIAGMEAQVSAKKAALDSLVEQVDAAKRKDQEAATKNQPYYDEKRRLDEMLNMHRLVYSKIQAEKLDMEIPRTSVAQITDYAEPGKAPVRPNKTVNISLGLVFGLLMGLGLAFFIEYLDTSVKTIDDVERTFQAPVLGVVPQNIGYLVEEGVESKHAEAYRVLRTNLLFSRKDETLNTIVVVSAGAGEGKSTTAINLATVFAQAGARILIVDSDLRRPTLHKLFKVSNSLGLTNYLLKQNTLPEIIQVSPVPNLDFMPSGKLPNSSMGILGSVQMKEMIAELKQRYDFIFFDSPPILGVSDASILASEVDIVMQVIQFRRYPQPMTIRAKQMIEKVGGNFAGIVLNNINMSQDEGYYYYSGYYHDYYYSRNPAEQETGAKTDGSNEGNKDALKQKS